MKHSHLTVNDLMTTAVVTVRSSETVGSAHTDMQMGMFRHLPVVDERGRLVGILSDRDILRALSRPKATLVAEVMTREMVTVKPTTSAAVAAELMVDRTIGSLPVINDEGQMVGLITQTDFLAVARRALLSLPLDGAD